MTIDRLFFVVLTLAFVGCVSGPLPAAPPVDGGACGAFGQRCCVASGPVADLAGAEYAFACDFAHGLWCEHDDGGVNGVCRRAP